jgi:hypothetical protein
MMKRLMTIGLIVACHVGAFVAIYFGRIVGVPLCGSDTILFVVPFVAAATAYAAVLVRMIRTRKSWTRGLLVAILSLLAGVISSGIGMMIAFNLWGT